MTISGKFLVGGEWRDSDVKVEIHYPYNNETIAHVYLASDSDIEDAIKSAANGFELTKKMPSHQRSGILYRLAEQLEERKDELAETLILEGGKTKSLAKAELIRSKNTILVAAEEAKRINGEILPLDWDEAGEGHTGFIRRFPIGTVLGITPFNYPLNLACHKLAPAIAAGNSFILKPSSKTPLSGLILGQMVIDAGYPEEAISVLPCSTDNAEKLVTDSRIAYLSFTGSPDVGWHLKNIAGKKRTGLELGGNAAVIIHTDSDIPHAVSRIAAGGFTNSGQNCISVQRVFLHRSIYKKTLDMLINSISKLRTGDPADETTDVGPMVSRSKAENAFNKVQRALDDGAKVVLGGSCEKTIFQPTILIDTKPEMDVNKTEMFAPIITVTPYDDFDEAISLADDSEYGLQMGIFTKDINRIMKAFEEINVGGLQINDVSTFRTDNMPYGGVKCSGLGREGPHYAIREMTEMKMMVINMPPEPK